MFMPSYVQVNEDEEEQVGVSPQWMFVIIVKHTVHVYNLTMYWEHKDLN